MITLIEKVRQVFRQFLDVIIIFLLILLYVLLPQSTIGTVLGFLFFFLPGYSVTRFLFRSEKVDFTSAVTYVLMISLSINPLLGNLTQLITVLTAYTTLLTISLFSLPFLMVSDLKPKIQVTRESNTKERTSAFYRKLAFLGAVLIGLGLYLVASWNVAAPRGYDLYGHIYVVNNIMSTGKVVFSPDVNMLSNFYVFTYTEVSLLTGMDVLPTGLFLQTFFGGVFAISIFYFAEYVTGSSFAAFVSVILFLVGPPIYANASPYFYYFHPMWVAVALFPFVLAFVHKSLLVDAVENPSLSPFFITAVFLYHLGVGLMVFAMLMIDFILQLAISRKKKLVANLGKLVASTLLVSSVLIVPFLSNISNPFKYVYPGGGLQTLNEMFFGWTTFQFASPSGGWNFFSTYIQEFLVRALPLLIVGIPAMIYLFLKRKKSFTLIFSAVSLGLLGIFQPWFGFAFLPQRFIQPLMIFGSTLVGFLVSRIAVIPHLQFTKRENQIKIRILLSRQRIGRLTLLLLVLCYIVAASYILLYSPARQAVLDAELYLTYEDLAVIKWIESNIPKNAKILMDQYFQFFFTGVTGRQRLFSITSDKPIYQVWDVYPANVYIGQTDPLKVDVDYIVISRWCYTTWSFVGKEYFDRQEGLKEIYEYRGSFAYGLYAVYQVTK